jgi:hypothetical protein
VEHAALIVTLPKQADKARQANTNSRMSEGVMTVDQATVKKVLLACRKSNPRTE